MLKTILTSNANIDVAVAVVVAGAEFADSNDVTVIIDVAAAVDV